jgi:hypothetical protein
MAPVAPWLAFTELGLWSELVLSMSFGATRHSMKLIERALFCHPPEPIAGRYYADRYQDEAPQAVLQAQMPHHVTGAWLAGVPALVLTPADDKLIPAEFGHMTALLHQARYVNIPELGHAAMLDRNWAAAAGTIAAWLDEQGH